MSYRGCRLIHHVVQRPGSLLPLVSVPSAGFWLIHPLISRAMIPIILMQGPGKILLMIQILRYRKDLWNYVTFLVMGNARFISSTA